MIFNKGANAKPREANSQQEAVGLTRQPQLTAHTKLVCEGRSPEMSTGKPKSSSKEREVRLHEGVVGKDSLGHRN